MIRHEIICHRSSAAPIPTLAIEIVEEIMGIDISKLVVGQEVYLIYGYWEAKGKVIEVTASDVVVEEMEGFSGRRYHFDSNGEFDHEDPQPGAYQWFDKDGAVTWDGRGFTFPECQPPRLDDRSFDERTALLEARRRA